MAYASRIGRCSSGGNEPTNFVDRRTLAMISSLSKLSGSRLRNSETSSNWKMEEARATPKTWPIPLKSCPKPVPTATADGGIAVSRAIKPVCKTTAFPKPSGIMLSQRAKKPDPSVIRAIRMPAAKGKIPQMFIRVLNRPVRLITHPANKEPAASETLFGIKCKPAVAAVSSRTVSNHIEKKYVMLKLHVATKKLDIEIKTGSFCASKKGAIIGSFE